MSTVVTTYVSPLAEVRGEVHFSEGCVVLPYAHIEAAANSRITFGPYCLVEEYAVICCDSNHVMTIGSCNHFKARCTLHNVHRIGHGNVFDSFTHITDKESSVECSSSPVVPGDVIEDDVVVTPHIHITFDSNSGEAASESHDVLLPAHTVVILSTDQGMSWQLLPQRGTPSAVDPMAESTKTTGDTVAEGTSEPRVKKLCRWYLQQLPPTKQHAITPA